MLRCESVDCLRRTLDWLYAHDLTKLFAGIANRARQVFGVKADQVHIETTSFGVEWSVRRCSSPREPPWGGRRGGRPGDRGGAYRHYVWLLSAHRNDLKQWMLALATTHDGDIPLFLQPLDGNSSDRVSLLSAIIAIQTQLREAEGEASVYVADNGVYSEFDPLWWRSRTWR